MIMRVLIALSLVASLFFASAPPLSAQVIVVPPVPAGGGGANQALNNTYDTQGIDADGLGTTVTASASVNVLGTYTTVYTAPYDVAGFCVFARSTSSNPRYQFSVRKGGSTVIVPDWYMTPGTITGLNRVCFPLNVASGQVLDIAVRSSTASAVLQMAIVGTARNSQSPPLWTSLAALDVDTANTRAGVNVVTADDGWDQLVASTGATYGGLMFMLGQASSAPTQGSIALAIGLGGSGSEAAIYEQPFFANNTSPTTPAGNGQLIEKTIPSGSRISARVKSATNADTFTVGVFGLVL